MLACRGPAWGSYDFDPSYVYLLNSLMLAEGRSPGHTDHPGTPVQAFGAAGLRLSHPTLSAEQRAYVVLAAPETHLRILVQSATVLAALMWLAAGWVYWRTSGSLLVALACQSLPLAFRQTCIALGWFTPELFFLCLSGWLGILATIVTERKASAGRRLIVPLGLFIGTAVMTKVTWVPLAAALLFVPGSWKARLCTAALAALTICGWALFILPELARTLGWLTQVATHTGHYGGGPSGLPEWAAYRLNLANLWDHEPMNLGLALVSCLGLLALYFRRPATIAAQSQARRMLGLLTLGCAGVLLAGAKHPAARYILPVAMVGPSIAYLALFGLASLPSPTARRLGQAVAVAILIATAIVGPRSLLNVETRMKEAQRQRIETERLCSLHPEARLVDFYRGLSVPYALRFGNSFSHEHFAGLLRRLYPAAISYNVFNAKFEHFGHWIEPAAFFADPTPVLLVGSNDLTSTFGPPFPKPPVWQMQRLASPGIHALYLLTPPSQP
jgi:hypothetical protein